MTPLVHLALASFPALAASTAGKIVTVAGLTAVGAPVAGIVAAAVAVKVVFPLVVFCISLWMTA